MVGTLVLECKEQKVPVSLVNAFVKPVSAADVVEESIRKLAAEADMTDRNYGIPVKERLWFCVDKYDIMPGSATKSFSAYPQLVDAALAALM